MAMPGEQIGGSIGGGIPPMGGEQQNQQHVQQQHQMEAFQPLATPVPHQAGIGGQVGLTGELVNHGVGGIMSGGMMSRSGGMGIGGYQQPGMQVPQRSAKKVPDWLIQTLKEKEALAEKQKKKGGISLSTDIASSSSVGAGNISGYNHVHSPSPSPPGSPSGAGSEGGGSDKRRAKPSWHEADDSDDPDDEVSPTKANLDRRASNGTSDDGRNGAKPAGILKGGMNKRSAKRPVEEDHDEESMTTATEMDEETRAAFDREIRRLLTQVLKEGTANISREVVMSAFEEARHASVAGSASSRLTHPKQSHPVARSKKEQREQKKAMGALIGGYGSESASPSESEDDASPSQGAAPSATVPVEESMDGPATSDRSQGVDLVGVEDVSSVPATRKVVVKVGGKWPLPAWADPPHEAPIPHGISVAVETIGPSLEVMKTQELSYSTTVMGRFEEQCGLIVEDGSASRYHAAIV